MVYVMLQENTYIMKKGEFMDTITRQEFQIHRNRYLTNQIGEKIIFKSNIAMNQSCSLICNTTHNGQIQPEMFKPLFLIMQKNLRQLTDLLFHAVAYIWNKLPDNFSSAPMHSSFKLRPKTFLFATAFYQIKLLMFTFSFKSYTRFVLHYI